MLGQLTRFYILLSVTLSLSLAAHAQSAVDSLKSRLAVAANFNDSVRLLYNIYDASPDEQQPGVLDYLYQLALNRGDYATAKDVLQQSSDLYATNDSLLRSLITRAKALPDSSRKESTLAYLNIRATENYAGSLSDGQIEEKLRDYLGRHARSEKYPTYERIEYLFKLCTYLRHVSNGSLLTKYFRELQELIDNLPSSDIALKYLFYKQAAGSYLTNRLIPEAVEANKTLLAIIDELRNRPDSKERSTSNYDKTAYQCYMRLLRTDGLSKEEIDDYYNKLQPLIERYPNLSQRSGEGKKPTIYLLMANKRYAEALPLIKDQLSDTINTEGQQIYLVEALLEASEALGDKKSQLMALEMSNKLIKERIDRTAAESYKELQLIYDVDDLRQVNDELALAIQEIEMQSNKTHLTYSVICLILLVVLLAVMFVLYRRSKRLTSSLERSNALIIQERDTMQQAQKDLIEARDKAKAAGMIKTDFINNMGHEIRTPLESIVEYSGLITDCALPDQYDRAKHYSDIISLNTDLLLTLVNDVLELPSLENAKVSIHPAKASLRQICSVVLDNARLHLKPGVHLVFANENQPDTIITTDPNRVEQVLLNLLTNAAKYTDSGTIALEYYVAPALGTVSFAVTDTGSGIPEGCEDDIFSRERKPGSVKKGNTLGLYLSRLLANMLGGSLILDEKYHPGARFIFTIPIS